MIQIPETIMGIVLALLAVLAGFALWRVHKAPDLPSLMDLVTATDRHGIVRFDARKCFEAGAFAVSTWAYVYLTLANRLTEWFFVGYMGAWVGARFLRDREKRLNGGDDGKSAQPG